jgi:hypothetical protein
MKLSNYLDIIKAAIASEGDIEADRIFVDKEEFKLLINGEVYKIDNYDKMIDYINEKEKRFICIQKCPELDCQDLAHCIATKAEIAAREDRRQDYCQCGNTSEWEELIVQGEVIHD